MRHIKVLSLFVLSCIASACVGVKSWIPRSIFESTIRIQTQQGVGTGTIIACRQTDDGYLVHVLTAKHMQVPGAVEHPDKDLEIFAVEMDRYYRPLPLRSTAPVLGEHLWTAGHPGGMPTQVYEGYAGRGGWIGNSGGPGMSGGPVVDDDGQLVGLVTAGWMYGPDAWIQASCWLETLDVPWIRATLEDWAEPSDS